jgi:hypothetical protein
MLVAIFYPLFDGGIQQIRQVYRGLTGKATLNHSVKSAEKETKSGPGVFPSSSSTGSTDEGH